MLISDVQLSPNGDGKTWTLLNEVTFKTELFTITVPAGFVTDLASVPRVFWSILPPFGTYIEAALLHDFLYRKRSDSPKVSRVLADAVFWEIMSLTNVKKWKRLLMYPAVRIGGWRSFRKKQHG